MDFFKEGCLRKREKRKTSNIFRYHVVVTVGHNLISLLLGDSLPWFSHALMREYDCFLPEPFFMVMFSASHPEKLDKSYPRRKGRLADYLL